MSTGTEGGEPTLRPDETLDAFHRGRFHLLQPKGRGHRAGIDAMMLAALVDQPGDITVADLGAGAGAAGLAVATRLPQAQITLFERAPEMCDFACRSLALAHNAALATRVRVVEADVALTGKARHAAGLPDDHFDQVIMNPPFNDGRDRVTPDGLKASAHAMTEDLFERWIRTACAIMVPGGQMSLIARPESVAQIIAACGRRFGGLEITPVHPRHGENAVRILVTAIKGSRSRLSIRSPLVMHDDPESHRFAADVDDLNNGRRGYPRRGR